MKSDTKIPFEEALQAVRERDQAYDGRFCFAVVTTGIYCRPSCSSRAANKENIRFFDNVDLAEQAGFRACKRCKPDKQNDEHTMIAVARFIEANSDSALTLAILSEQFDLSQAHLQKKFKSMFGMSPRVFQDGIRQDRFKVLLRGGESVTDALYIAGYGSSSRVYENAHDQLGMTPSAYKSGAPKEDISYVCVKTRCGLLLLAATDKGLCFAMFGNAEAELLALLKIEFPKAAITIASNSEQLNVWLVEIERYLATKSLMPLIPLDLRGTAFQLKVWQFLQSIPEGKPINYKEVAEGIGQPSAIRAAATACAKNRIALLVPCHRVLRSDGGLGGYRWGLELKRELLVLEKQNAKKHN